jgi:hypothetical protein
LGGAATLALVTTVGLVAYERQGRSPTAEPARPAAPVKLATAPQATPPQKPPAPAPQPPPAVPAAAPAAAAPAPAAPVAPAPVRAPSVASPAPVARPGAPVPAVATPAPVARPAAPAPGASDAPPVLAFAAPPDPAAAPPPVARNEAFASAAAPLLSAKPAVPQPSPAPPAAEPASPAASPAPEWPARSRSFIESAAAPTNCLPAALRTVLGDLAAKFPEVKVIATRGLQTDNHSSGSARAKMHDACMAVDIRTGAAVAEVTAYLRTRREIAGLNSYRTGVIHLDVPESARFAVGATAPPPREARAAASEPRRVRLRRQRPAEPAAAVAAAPTAEATTSGARRAAATIPAPGPAAPRSESDRGGDSSP